LPPRGGNPSAEVGHITPGLLDRHLRAPSSRRVPARPSRDREYRPKPACVRSSRPELGRIDGRPGTREPVFKPDSANGAAQESNLPSLGLPDLTGFEDGPAGLSAQRSFQSQPTHWPPLGALADESTPPVRLCESELSLPSTSRAWFRRAALSPLSFAANGVEEDPVVRLRAW
jgi:hypothetical protein